MSGKSKLNIFDDGDPPQVVVQSGYFEDMYPQDADLNSTTNEFYIPGSDVQYLDLRNTLLTVQLKVVKKSGADMVAGDQAPVPSDLFMHALFQDVTLSLNDTVIEGGASLYPYKAFIESLLSYPQDKIHTELRAAGYHSNPGTRQSWVRESKLFELAGVLRIDFFNQPKYLIPGVSVRIKLKRATANFSLCYKAGETEPADGTWKIIIEKMLLYVRRVTVHPTVLKAHTLGMQTRNALYPYTSSKIVSYTIANGSKSFSRENLFSSSVLPKLVVIGLVRTVSFKGTVKHRSLALKHFGVTKVDLKRDGQSVPYRNGYDVDITEHVNDVYARSVLQNTNVLNTCNSNALKWSNINGTETLFVFNLTPDFDLAQRQTIKDSSLRLELEFNSALTESINVIAYACYDTSLQINTGGNIIRDGFG